VAALHTVRRLRAMDEEQVSIAASGDWRRSMPGSKKLVRVVTLCQVKI